MFAWFHAMRARQRAARKERDALVKIVGLLKESEQQFKRSWVRAACGLINPDTIWLVGERYTCHQCGKNYKHDRRCVWGLCRKCS